MPPLKPDPIECKVGDMVTWDSHGGGNLDMKTGRVVWVLNKNDPLTPRMIAAREFPNHSWLFRGTRFPPHFDVWYLISVPHGRRAKPRLYMPYPRHLRFYEESIL